MKQISGIDFSVGLILGFGINFRLKSILNVSETPPELLKRLSITTVKWTYSPTPTQGGGILLFFMLYGDVPPSGGAFSARLVY